MPKQKIDPPMLPSTVNVQIKRMSIPFCDQHCATATTQGDPVDGKRKMELSFDPGGSAWIRRTVLDKDGKEVDGSYELFLISSKDLFSAVEAAADLLISVADAREKAQEE